MSKKLVWGMMNRLKIRAGSFRDYYAKIYSPLQFPVDRFNQLSDLDDYGIETYNIVPDPAPYTLSNLSHSEEYWYDRFYELCNTIADVVYSTANDRKIVIMYSGGCDSSTVLTAMMRHPRYREFLDSGRFFVSLNTYSIREFPEFFYSHILPVIPLIPTDYRNTINDPDYLLVSGDGGDYFICNTDVPAWEYEGTTDIFDMPKEVIYKYFDINDPSGKFSNMMRHISKSAPFELESVSQIYWWLGQSFTNQGEMCYPIAWCNLEPQEMFGFNKYFRFFLHPLWTAYGYEYMSTRPVHKNLRDMRRFQKRYIIDFNGHQTYWNKDKILSQRNIARIWYKSAIYSDGSWDNDSEILT
jgi:hypothetical protein